MGRNPEPWPWRRGSVSASRWLALPDEQREAFVLREETGLGLQDIAAATGVSAETAKSRLRYAVRKLKAMLADD